MQTKSLLKRVAASAAVAAGFLLATMGSFVITALIFGDRRHDSALAWSVMTGITVIGLSLLYWGYSAMRS